MARSLLLVLLVAPALASALTYQSFDNTYVSVERRLPSPHLRRV
jgi:hypothetical protein